MKEHVDYLLYVESVEPMPFPERLERSIPPFLLRPRELPWWLRADLRHMRLSGPGLQTFEQWADSVTRIVGDIPKDTERKARRSELRKFAEKVPLYVVDVLLVDDLLSLLEISDASGNEGAWLHVVLRDLERGDDVGALALIADDTPDAEPQVRRVASIRPVDPTLERRLRDIYSLKHVFDATFDGGEESNASPPHPQDPPPRSEDVITPHANPQAFMREE